MRQAQDAARPGIRMARRSGWTIVKQIARDIDRANRAQQRANIAHQKAVLREEERAQRQAVREREALVRQGARLQEQFNRAINAANTATNLSTKESKLHEARAKLEELKQLSTQYTFFSLNNLSEVENGIRQIQAEVDALKREHERKKSLEESAVSQTEDAEKARAALAHVLLDTLAVNDALDWEVLEDTAPFAIPEPIKPPQPMMPPEPVLDYIPMKPNATDPPYTPRIPLLARLSRKRKAAILQTARQQYEADLADWQQEADTLKADNGHKVQEWEDAKRSLIADWNDSYRLEHESWERRRAEFMEAQDQYNADLPTLRHQYDAGEKTAIEEYCSLVLSRSSYPFPFSKDYQLNYLPDAQVLALDGRARSNPA